MTGAGPGRRNLLRAVLAGATVTAAGATGCRRESSPVSDEAHQRSAAPADRTPAPADRLTAPVAARRENEGGVPDGVSEVPGLPGHRPAVAYLPTRGRADPLPLVVMLHGAGGEPQRSIEVLRPLADEHGFAVLAPKSRGATWDRVLGSFGPDVRNIDAVLQRFSRRAPVSRVVLAGFSDGASYALSLGLSNGDVLDAVMAFSPGFAAPGVRRGAPPIFVSHGVDDEVLPIDRCSRRLVPALRGEGYDVTYREFDGGHQMPLPIREEAVRWLGEQR